MSHASQIIAVLVVMKGDYTEPKIWIVLAKLLYPVWVADSGLMTRAQAPRGALEAASAVMTRATASSAIGAITNGINSCARGKSGVVEIELNGFGGASEKTIILSGCKPVTDRAMQVLKAAGILKKEAIQTPNGAPRPIPQPSRCRMSYVQRASPATFFC